jgi:hypothetical protein
MTIPSGGSLNSIWISPRSASTVPRRLPVDLGRAAEFAAPPDDRAVQQPATRQILKQRRHPLIELRQLLLHDPEVLRVRIPPAVVDGDVRDAVLDQTPCDEAGLAELGECRLAPWHVAVSASQRRVL